MSGRRLALSLIALAATNPFDNFGRSVATAGDAGILAAAGAIGEDSAAIGVGGDQMDNSAMQSGAAYVITATMP